MTVSVKTCDPCDDATKTESRWLALLLRERFWKASVHAHVASTSKKPPQTEEWLRSSCESNDSGFVTRMTTPHTLFTAQQLSSPPLCQSYLSPFFFDLFIFPLELCNGWGENTNVVYRLITAHGLEWSLLQDASKYSWWHLHAASSPWADEELFPLFVQTSFLY